MNRMCAYVEVEAVGQDQLWIKLATGRGASSSASDSFPSYFLIIDFLSAG
jgi:hypothetical protein